ncbi:MAG: penicillin-binding transpeptidase domain-containing protein, partial [Desulfobacterota bacterium]|nr:penicillin-binding transpeptidase domain-containing protein [Thermodesulfobacteriota bacterium]
AASDVYKSQPLNIATGIKLELGSTAKLRTLATYLMAIDEVDNLLTQNPLLANTLFDDKLSKWVIEYRLLHPEAAKEELLKASLQRKFSANPHTAFFTGGGLHGFKNFKEDQDDKYYTLEEGLSQSVNLVFIRLMKELVNHYIAKLGYDKKKLLSSPDHPQRKALLKEAAEEEAINFLRKFYRIHHPKTYAQSREILCQSRLHPIRNWSLIYLKEKPQVSYGEFVTQAKARFGESSLDFSYLQKLFKSYRGKTFSLADEAYLLGKHPLEVWIVGYFKTHPRASWQEVLNASKDARALSSAWLFKKKFFSAQNLRIKALLEKKAFTEIHRNWKSLGYPFGSLVPSLATTIGSSSDRPISLAELIGIIINKGIYKPTFSLPRLHFAIGTPYETQFSQITPPGKRVMSPEVARVLKEALVQVVEQGTAQRIKNTFIRLDNTPMEIGGKTGTGDNRFETFRQGGAIVSSKIINRTSTFVFFVDNYFGIVTAHVEGMEASEYEFTSALAVQVLKILRPALEPLFQNKK